MAQDNPEALERALHGPAVPIIAPIDQLRVCADPNNLPFSNQQQQGFENAIARMAANDLHRRLVYYWWPQRRGFVRKTLKSGHCDVVIGVPSRMDMLKTTTPYYRSSYVFLTRHDRHLDIHSLDDPRLRNLQIGVHAVGDDYANVPPAMALAQRGLVQNLHGYSIYGDYSRPDPTRALIDAVANRSVDVAIAWGPLAGYFAQREPVALDLVPLQSDVGSAQVMRFDMSMGVRREDKALLQSLNEFIRRRQAAINAVLRHDGVPLVAGDDQEQGGPR
ncbi:substrate-binding domain-containing protein [Dyella sp. KRB-257]|uniref:substrate-binding domain-containing protein n=1 Tax=Dyella sp. KRB-257 TaxID=3400915 RepID=UPI003C00AAD0